jgi:D-alanyl-lipoteichoic acid acyltransferase DltB (MBOAT superfamily)
MPFTDFTFALFFFGVAVLYHLMVGRSRRIMLLAASLVFYLYCGWAAALVAVGMCLAVWWAARSRSRLTAGIVLTLAWLVVCKLLGSAVISGLSSSGLHAIQPIGLSFLVFRLIAYLVDVRRGMVSPFSRPDDLLLFALFFLEAPSGPIERTSDLWPQLQKAQRLTLAAVFTGIQQIVLGLFKKLVIADTAAQLVNEVYAHPGSFAGFQVLVAAVYYSIQIYADFSGYTDIALGYGRILGLRLALNFDRPYFAESIAEFWRRWHITLSNWLRDYLYAPVNWWFFQRWSTGRVWGIRSEYLVYSMSIFMTYLVCGLWHGIGWTFLLWGGLHGVYLIVSNLLRPYRNSWRKRLRKRPRLLPLQRGFDRLIVFALITLAWVFFRADSLPNAITIVRQILTPGAISAGMLYLGISRVTFIVWAMGLVCLGVLELRARESGFDGLFARIPSAVRSVLILLMALTVLFFGDFSTGHFIYFDF